MMHDDPRGRPAEAGRPSRKWRPRVKTLAGARLSLWQAALALALLIGLALSLGLLLARQPRFTRLTPQRPALHPDEMVSILLSGTRPARVWVRSIPTDQPPDAPLARRWEEALQAVPGYLEPASPVYVVAARGGDVQLAFSPTADDPRTIPDLYRWDAGDGTWHFVPVEVDPFSGERSAAAPSGLLALFLPSGTVPWVGTSVDDASAVETDHLDVVSVVLIPGGTVGADGSLGLGGLPALADAEGTYSLFLIVATVDPAARDALLADQPALDALMESLLRSPEIGSFAGVVLDFGPLSGDQPAAFGYLLAGLSEILSERGRLLAVRMPTPQQDGGGWDTSGYDWPGVGAEADLLIVTPPGTPGDYHPGGDVDAFLGWAVRQVSRAKLAVNFSTLSVDQVASSQNAIPYDYALAPLNTVSLLPEQAGSPAPGQALSFNLSGPISNLELDESGGLYSYRVIAGDGEHRVWIMTAEALQQRLDWLASWHIGGVVLDDLFAPGCSPDVLEAARAFQTGQPPAFSSPLAVRWQVADASGALLLETVTGLGTPLVWQPAEEGEFVIEAYLNSEPSRQRGAVAVQVARPDLATPALEGETQELPAGASAAAPTPLAIPEGMPVPVYPPGRAAFGRFELGGQVNHVIHHPELMRQAGMTWVKFQLTWDPDKPVQEALNLIQQGRSQGFKVLLSIVTGQKHPTSINVPAYLEFLRRVAYYGPNAIEVWNEPNTEFEWPRGEIDGAVYVREMLAPAYNAIKEVNPNVMVISGAPLPTGLYYSEGGCSSRGYGCDDWLFLQQMAQAGAANYMDCVGAHYNSGATAPSASTGHPADPGYQHYSWYFGGMLQLYGGTFGHPVCFTEFGYLSGEGFGSVPGRFNWAAQTTVEQQAAWLAEAARLSRQSGNVRLMIVWNVDFDDYGDADPKAGYAILRPDGRCPACAALGNVMR